MAPERDGYVIVGTGAAQGMILWGGDGAGITRRYASQVLRQSQPILLAKVPGCGVKVEHITNVRRIADFSR